MKYTKFRDIPQFTRSGSYQVNVSWRYLEEQFAQYEKGYGLELDPDFQRAHVWDENKQRRYVEYVLRGGKSSRTIYFNCATWMGTRTTVESPVQLVDGKQRIEAVRAFLNGHITAFDSYIHEFEDNLPWMGTDFVFVVNDLKTRAEVLQWYLDLNSGGVVHTEEELEKVRKLLESEAGK
jgi:hypothetical protein